MDIPPDIRKTAFELSEKLVGTDEKHALAIAAALMAERQHCAKIADDFIDDFRGVNSGDARAIAAAIRTQ